MEEDSSTTALTIERIMSLVGYDPADVAADPMDHDGSSTPPAFVLTTTPVLEDSSPAAVVTALVDTLLYDASHTRHAWNILYALVVHQPAVYHALAFDTVHRRVVRTTTTAADSDVLLLVSTPLLQALVSQVWSSPQVHASHRASETLVACGIRGGPYVQAAVWETIARFWQGQLQSASSWSPAALGTAQVRLVTLVVDCLRQWPENETTSQLLVSHNFVVTHLAALVRDGSDPLVQMSLLDVLGDFVTQLVVVDDNRRPMAVRLAWLVSPPMVQPLVQLAGGNPSQQAADPDPLVGGPALKVLAALARLVGYYHHHDDEDVASNNNTKDHEAALLEGFYRALQVHVASAQPSELDRLALVDALSSFASASVDSLQWVLRDAALRTAWLNLPSQAKLQAVVLTSVAMVLETLQQQDSTKDEASETNHYLLELYNWLGKSQGTPYQDTTEWLLSSRIGLSSPFPELRLATYRLWKAVATSHPPRGTELLLLWKTLDQKSVVETLIQRRAEPTSEGRLARYHVVQTVRTLLEEYSQPPHQLLLSLDHQDAWKQRLDQFIKEGPHYVATQSWDVATE